MTPGSDIQALLDSVPGQPGIRLSRRPPLVIPPGDYEVTSTLVVSQCVDLDMTGVTLWPVQGMDALRFDPGAAWSSMRGVIVVGATQEHAGVGVLVRAHGVRIDDVIVREMGTGVRVWGTAGDGTNANCCSLSRALLFGCYEVGLHLKGGDCNAGEYAAIEVVGANAKTRIGVLDESFLGNMMRGLHISSTREHAVKITAVANYSTWDGTYLENDCGFELPQGVSPILSQPGATWTGGNAIVYVRSGDRLGMGKSRVRFGDITPDGDELSVTIPHAPDRSYLALSHSSGSTAHPSGGVEMLLRRTRTSGVVDWMMRKSGAVVSAFAATRADHPSGTLGKLVAKAAADVGDLPPVRRVSALPALAPLGECVEVVTPNGRAAWLRVDGPNGPYWQPVTSP